MAVAQWRFQLARNCDAVPCRETAAIRSLPDQPIEDTFEAVDSHTAASVPLMRRPLSVRRCLRSVCRQAEVPMVEHGAWRTDGSLAVTVDRADEGFLGC